MEIDHKYCKPVLGFVDRDWGVSPRSDDLVLLHKTVLSSRPWRFIRLPAFRHVLRFGLFIDPVRDPTKHISKPRVILQIASQPEQAVSLRFVRPKYRANVNSMGGELLMLQFDDSCLIMDGYGVFLGIVEAQYTVKPEQVGIDVYVQIPGLGNVGHLHRRT